MIRRKLICLPKTIAFGGHNLRSLVSSSGEPCNPELDQNLTKLNSQQLVYFVWSCRTRIQFRSFSLLCVFVGKKEEEEEQPTFTCRFSGNSCDDTATAVAAALRESQPVASASATESNLWLARTGSHCAWMWCWRAFSVHRHCELTIANVEADLRQCNTRIRLVSWPKQPELLASFGLVAVIVT